MRYLIIRCLRNWEFFHRKMGRWYMLWQPGVTRLDSFPLKDNRVFGYPWQSEARTLSTSPRVWVYSNLPCEVRSWWQVRWLSFPRIFSVLELKVPLPGNLLSLSETFPDSSDFISGSSMSQDPLFPRPGQTETVNYLGSSYKPDGESDGSIWILTANYVYELSCFFFFFSSCLAAPWDMEFPDHGSDPSCSCDPHCSRSNTRSYTHRAELRIEPVSHCSWDTTNLVMPQWERQSCS